MRAFNINSVQGESIQRGGPRELGLEGHGVGRLFRRLAPHAHGAVLQNLRRGHYELAAEETVSLRVPAAFDELVMAI